MSDNSVTFVKTQSPVEDTSSYLYKWDSAVRQNFWSYEASISQLKQGISALYKNPLTSFRDEIQFGHRYSELETLKLKQQVGKITAGEVKDINAQFGGQYYVINRFGSLATINTPLMGAAFAACGALAGYAKFARGQNMLWFIGAFVPFGTVCLYNHVKQPTQHIQNCYSYLLGKRAATVEMQANSSAFAASSFASQPEFSHLKASLQSSNKTLYELEAELVNSISSGKF